MAAPSIRQVVGEAIRVAAADIANNTITSANLAANSVVATTITDSVVSSAKLAANAVVLTTITAGVITVAKQNATFITDNAITTATTSVTHSLGSALKAYKVTPQSNHTIWVVATDNTTIALRSSGDTGTCAIFCSL